MPKIKKTIFQPTVDINATVKAGPITGPKKEPFNKNDGIAYLCSEYIKIREER